jgi:hypothetical protein
MAYVLLPPAGGVLLLITEHKSDFVRYGFALYGREEGRADEGIGFMRGRVRCCLRFLL